MEDEGPASMVKRMMDDFPDEDSNTFDNVMDDAIAEFMEKGKRDSDQTLLV